MARGAGPPTPREAGAGWTAAVANGTPQLRAGGRHPPPSTGHISPRLAPSPPHRQGEERQCSGPGEMGSHSGRGDEDNRRSGDRREYEGRRERGQAGLSRRDQRATPALQNGGFSLGSCCAPWGRPGAMQRAAGGRRRWRRGQRGWPLRRGFDTASPRKRLACTLISHWVILPHTPSFNSAIRPREPRLRSGRPWARSSAEQQRI